MPNGMGLMDWVRDSWHQSRIVPPRRDLRRLASEQAMTRLSRLYLPGGTIDPLASPPSALGADDVIITKNGDTLVTLTSKTFDSGPIENAKATPEPSTSVILAVSSLLLAARAGGGRSSRNASWKGNER